MLTGDRPSHSRITRETKGCARPLPVGVLLEVSGRARRQDKETEGVEIGSKTGFGADGTVLYTENPMSHFITIRISERF